LIRNHRPSNATKAKEVLTHKVPKLIVGRSLESLLYAWRTQTKIVVQDPEYVFRHDLRFSNYDLSFMNAENPKQLYNNLTFALGLTSLMICPNKISNIRKYNKEVNIITNGNRRVTLHVDEFVRFDEATKIFNVYDFFDTREMSANDTSMLTDPDEDFIYQLNRYKTPRVEHNRTKDLVGASRMTLEQLLSPDYGQGIAMLKILRMLKSAGINGKFAWQRKDKRYYKRPKIEFFKRVTSQVLKPIYSLEEIYNMKQMEEKPWKTLEMLRKRVET
jgi:hypothetical protein